MVTAFLPCRSLPPQTSHRLTSLRALHLSGHKIVVGCSVQLPTSLTSLHLGELGAHRLPLHTLSQLPGLQRLTLSAQRAPSPEFEALSCLGALTRLHLLGYAYVPESLAALTWLRELRWSAGGQCCLPWPGGHLSPRTCPPLACPGLAAI